MEGINYHTTLHKLQGDMVTIVIFRFKANDDVTARCTDNQVLVSLL